MVKRTGIRRLYREMSKDNRDLSFMLEREHAMEVLLTAKFHRDQMEQRKVNEDGRKRTARQRKSPKKKVAKPPPPSPKMLTSQVLFVPQIKSQNLEQQLNFARVKFTTQPHTDLGDSPDKKKLMNFIHIYYFQ